MTPATLPPATRAILRLVAPQDAARDGASDALVVLGAATLAGLVSVALRGGPGRVVVELRQLPPASLHWHAREMERHLGPAWRVSTTYDSRSHLVARRTR